MIRWLRRLLWLALILVALPIIIVGGHLLLVWWSEPDGPPAWPEAGRADVSRFTIGSPAEVIQVAAVNPRGLFVDSKDQVWVVSQDHQQLQIISDDGKSDVIVDHRIFEFPHQVVVNAAGEAFVTDGYQKSIWKVVRGRPPQVLVSGDPLVNPVGLALVEDRLVVVDPRAQTVFRLSEDNKLEPWFEIRK